MKILPDLQEIAAVVKTGQYRMLPVSCEILSDFITPIEAFRSWVFVSGTRQSVPLSAPPLSMPNI